MEMAASLLRNQTQIRGQKQNTQESELSLPRNI